MPVIISSRNAELGACRPEVIAVFIIKSCATMRKLYCMTPSCITPEAPTTEKRAMHAMREEMTSRKYHLSRLGAREATAPWCHPPEIICNTVLLITYNDMSSCSVAGVKACEMMAMKNQMEISNEVDE